MYKKVFLSLAVITAFAGLSQAQQFQSAKSITAPVGYAAGDLSRPRLVNETRESAVASSIIVNTAELEQVAFELLNRKRIENGLQQLVWSDQIAAVARMHSKNMAELKFFGHRGLDNKLVSDRADQKKLGRWRAIGENIAYNRGYKDPVDKAIDNWLNSQSHRHNLLSSEWKESAVGVAVADDGSYYFTQVFLKK